MKMIYSAWARQNEVQACCLLEGVEPLKFPDGTIDPECEVLLYSFEANSGEEAMAIYYIRQGWGNYEPEGDSIGCPQCGSYYYPEGSGQCWNCSHID